MVKKLCSPRCIYKQASFIMFNKLKGGAMKLHIYLFRHGQTFYNRDKIFTGWKESRLTPLGIRQARIVAHKLKNKKIDVAFQTELSRSKDTLKEVLKFHPECREIITANQMIERSYGDLEGLKHNTIIKKYGEERFDLFVKEVIHFIFSEEMIKRANATYEFDVNLTVKIANPHDLILMKCATDRIKDKEDVIDIINKTKIDWEIIINEALNQIKLGKERAVFDVTCFLEDLRKMMDVNIPPVTLEKLFELVERQAKEKKKKLSVH